MRGDMDKEADSMDLVIAGYKKDVDVGLLRENQKRKPEERVRLLQEFLELRERLQEGMKKQRDSV